jgi:hypothetical protein
MDAAAQRAVADDVIAGRGNRPVDPVRTQRKFEGDVRPGIGGVAEPVLPDRGFKESLRER